MILKIYHPLTKYYLKAIQRSSNGCIEIGAGENGDLWIIEKNDDSISKKNINNVLVRNYTLRQWFIFTCL
jgi:hypothetical protein